MNREIELIEMIIEEYKIRLSIQRALLDKITSNLRQIVYLYENDLISLYFFYDEELSEEEKELAGDVSAEVIADFPESCMIEYLLKVVKYPAKITTRGHIVYSKFE